MADITTRIKVVGVGGCGTNTVVSMIKSGLRGVEFYMVNTDNSHLNKAMTEMLSKKEVEELGDKLHKINIGVKVTKGQGAGADPSVGEKAAEESLKELNDMLGDTDLLFIVAGMGGGTGTGASPVIARLAKDINPDILIISAVTKPFHLEFAKKLAVAEKGIEKLQRYVDSLIIISNQRMVEGDAGITLIGAYEKVNRIISNAVRSISDLINFPSVINVDFADIKKTMKGKGYSHIGLGMGDGTSTSDRMIKAVKAAANTDVLNTSINGATGLIINIQSSSDIAYSELDEAYNFISDLVSRDVECIFGHQIDESLKEKVIVTIIAAGCKAENAPTGGGKPMFGAMQQPAGGQRSFGSQQRSVSRVAQAQIPQRQQPQTQQNMPPRAISQPIQPPAQPTRIDSTQGREVQNETPSFMKRFLGKKRNEQK